MIRVLHHWCCIFFSSNPPEENGKHTTYKSLKENTSNRSNTWLSSSIIPNNTICWWLGRCCMVPAASCCALWLACCLRMAAVKPLMPRQTVARSLIMGRAEMKLGWFENRPNAGDFRGKSCEWFQETLFWDWQIASDEEMQRVCKGNLLSSTAKLPGNSATFQNCWYYISWSSKS